MSPVLEGGARNRQVKRISKGRRIDKSRTGQEGIVRRVIATVKRGVKTKKVELAEKAFYPRAKLPPYSRATQPNLRNPEAQYQIMKRVQALNRKFNLRLPILPTMRMRTLKTGEKRVYSTVLKNVLYYTKYWDGIQFYEWKRQRFKSIYPGEKDKSEMSWVKLKVSRSDKLAIIEEKARIRLLLRAFDIEVTLQEDDAWMYTYDKKTKKVKVWLADFGNVVDIHPRDKRAFLPFEIEMLNKYLPSNK
jgi:hypothetical protein